MLQLCCLERILQCLGPYLFASLALEAKSCFQDFGMSFPRDITFAEPGSRTHVALPAMGARKLAFSAAQVGWCILLLARFIRWEGHSGPQKSGRQKTVTSVMVPCPGIPYMVLESLETSFSPRAGYELSQGGDDATTDAWSLSLFGCVIVTTN